MSNLLLDDRRSVFGRTIKKISKLTLTECDQLTPNLVKSNLKYWLPSDEEMRISAMAKELFDVKHNEHIIEGFTEEEIDDMLEYICIN